MRFYLGEKWYLDRACSVGGGLVVCPFPKMKYSEVSKHGFGESRTNMGRS
jgi:hypothetical protein